MIKPFLFQAALIAVAIAAYFLFPFNLAFLTRVMIMIILVLSIDLVLGYAQSPHSARRPCMARALMPPVCSPFTYGPIPLPDCLSARLQAACWPLYRRWCWCVPMG